MPLPDRAHWLAYGRFLGCFLAVFVPVYVGSGHLLAQQPGRSVALHLAWEPGIALLPWMIWPYLSLFSLYLLPLLYLRPPEMQRLAGQSMLAVVLAGAFFVLMPTRSGFAPVAVTGLHAPLFRLMADLDTPFNLFPSLHVSSATLLVLGCTGHLGLRAVWLYRGWLALLAASTVLVHQHHVADVLGGFVLALAVRRVLVLRPSPVGA